MEGILFGFVVIFIFAWIVIHKCVKIVRTSEEQIVEKFGKYSRTLSAGLNFINPITDKVVKIVDLKQQIMDVPPQGVITRDNVTIRIDTVVFERCRRCWEYRISAPLWKRIFIHYVVWVIAICAGTDLC